MEPFTLTRDDAGQLILARPGQEDVANVRVRRAFPLSSEHRYVSLRDKEGKELLLVDDLADVPPEPRAVIEAALAAGTFVPKINRVESVDVRFGYQLWQVQTDRGPASFRVQEREDIRFLPDGRFRIKDADGTVYEMRSLGDLDDVSRRAVEPLM